MSDNQTAAAIREALRIERTAECAAAVKSAVAKSIVAVDRRIDVQATDYFNHSFAPDLVLTWPHLPTEPERPVFLRFNEDPSWIEKDLPYIEASHPLVYGLTPARWADAPDELAQRSADAKTLVTDPDGVDQLAAAHASRLEGLVSRTIVRGGQGLLDRPRAAKLTSEIAEGFESARRADPDGTLQATRAAAEILSASDSARIISFLQAMWLSSGAQLSSFPAPSQASTDPGDEGLSFLISQEEITDPDFWRALGGGLSLERLVKLGVSGAPANLQHLVRANVDRLWARACRVQADEQQRLHPSDRLSWGLHPGLLALIGADFTAFFAPRAEDIDRVNPDRTAGLSLEAFQGRAQARAAIIADVELTSGDREVTYRSIDHADVSGEGDRLIRLAAALDGPVQVRKATVFVSDRSLDLDFTTRTMSARTKGQPPLDDILRIALPLLWQLANDELQDVEEMHAAASQYRTQHEQLELELFHDRDQTNGRQGVLARDAGEQEGSSGGATGA